MKIVEIEIQSLFGYFDHKIPLKTDDRITIIHGPNGVGKTTLLRLISDLFAQRFYSLLEIPFGRIVVRFGSSDSLIVEKITKESEDPYLKLISCMNKKKREHKVEPLHKNFRRNANILEHKIDHIRRTGLSEWYDEIEGDFLSLEEVFWRYKRLLSPDLIEHIPSLPDQIEKVLEKINIVVVETQRLSIERKDEEFAPPYSPYRRREAAVQRMTVEEDSKDIIDKIEECQRESGEIGASLDSTFPQRILDSKLLQGVPEKTIRQEYANQLEYRDRLMNSGLIAAEEKVVPIVTENLAAHDRKVLSIYLEDVKSKLEVFDRLLRQVELFEDIVNSRFSYKKFKVDREKGFIFKSSHDESVVPPSSLSSGEQHEIVLAYELLFKAQPGSLILIDEPELSLHVTWQRKFLEDIAKISELADLDIIVATHSPSIIHNRRDLMVDLAGGEKN